MEAREGDGGKDLKAVGLSENWYGEAQIKGTWRAAWNQCLSEHQHTHEAGRADVEKNVLCTECVQKGE